MQTDLHNIFIKTYNNIYNISFSEFFFFEINKMSLLSIHFLLFMLDEELKQNNK